MRWWHYIKLLFILGVICITIYVFRSWIFDQLAIHKEGLANAEVAVAIVGGLLGLLTLILIWLQLVAQTKQSRLTRTYQFSEKLQNTEFLEHLSLALTYFEDTILTEEERWHGYIDNRYPETAVHVYITMAFFEDMAMLYNENNISRKLIKRLLRTMIIDYYESSQWFRTRMQNLRGEQIYKEWDKVYIKLTVPWWNLLARW